MKEVEKDLRVDCLVRDLFELLDVVNNLTHRHVMQSCDPVILFQLQLLLLFKLLQHHVNVFFFLFFDGL